MDYRSLAWFCRSCIQLVIPFRFLSNRRFWSPILDRGGLWTKQSWSGCLLAWRCTRKSITRPWSRKRGMVSRLLLVDSGNNLTWICCRCIGRFTSRRDTWYRRRWRCTIGRFLRWRSNAWFFWIDGFRGLKSKFRDHSTQNLLDLSTILIGFQGG